MYEVTYSFIVWIATFIGAITGLGGGIMIKPAFDFVGLDQAAMISVYSTIAVFSMCIVSLYKRWDDVKNSQRKIALGLSIGSIVGGLSGEQIFQMALQYWGNRLVSLSQSILLVIILVGIIIYAFFQEKISTHSLNQLFGIMVLGWSVGWVSVFLGIIRIHYLKHLEIGDTKQSVLGKCTFTLQENEWDLTISYYTMAIYMLIENMRKLMDKTLKLLVII